MNDKLKEAIDLAIEESQKPIIIEGNYGDGKSSYLRDKYNPIAVYLPEATKNDLFITYNGDRKILPKWYVNLCTSCVVKPEIQNLLILDALEQANEDIFLRILSDIILNEKEDYYLPENAQIVFITNGKTPEEQEILLSKYNDYFTFVKLKDRNNIQVLFGANYKKKSK